MYRGVGRGDPYGGREDVKKLLQVGLLPFQDERRPACVTRHVFFNYILTFLVRESEIHGFCDVR